MQPLLRWKKISVTYSECVFVALVIQHEMRMRHIVICGLPRSTVLSTLFHYWQDFRGGKKKNLSEKIVCFDFLQIKIV